MPRVPKLPELLERKLYKTGQTRGADDDVIFQNRVSRNSTVLIPFSHYGLMNVIPGEGFENGFIILINPDDYFNDPAISQIMDENEIVLGENSLLFYETRGQWLRFNVSVRPRHIDYDFSTVYVC